MSDALINGVAGAERGIIARLITYPLANNESIAIFALISVNTRQQTNWGPKKTKRKLTTIEQMCQVFWFLLSHVSLSPASRASLISSSSSLTSLSNVTLAIIIPSSDSCNTEDLFQEYTFGSGI
ncbi:hypothetical protein Syun_004868 [Stephania yunnanensis]|uniref:Uncharacterized protein n=1 Tax=Stephania yunnanensis TaxID=152371 RepID=A0AAP0L488_9MAGN